MKRFSALIFAYLFLISSATAWTPQQLIRFNGGPSKPVYHGPGSIGWLAACSGSFSFNNVLLQSQTFSTVPWGLAGSGATAPTLTMNTVTAPDSTLTGSTLAFPAVSGAGNSSVLYQLTSSTADWPYTADIWVKGAVGGERLWLIATATGSGDFSRTAITATTSWQRITLTFQNKAADQYFEFGIDLRDGSQSAQSAQSVYVWGADLFQYSRIPGTYFATSTAAVAQVQTLNCPTGLAFRDFSQLVAYSGNPITPQNTASYNSGGTSDPYLTTTSKVASAYYAFANCTTNGATTRENWPNQCLYSGTDPLHWTDYSAGNPLITASSGSWDDHFILHGTITPWCSLAAWCFYYSGMNTSNHSSIGIAYSSSLPGTWTKYSANPLSLGSTGTGNAYDSLPAIIVSGSTQYMYSAVNDNDSGYIAVWTSPVGDGVNWTFDGAALQGPVTSGQWNYASFPYVIDPYVFKNSHGFYEMAYTAFSGNYLPHQKMGYAIATTPDGPFYPYAGGPLVDQFSTVYPGDTNIGDGVFIENPNDKTFYPQGTFYLLFNDDNADDDDAGNGTTGLSHGLAATMPDY